MRAVFAALALFALGAGVATAQGPASAAPQPRTIAGIVVDATTGAPLPGVLVRLENAERTMLTGTDGRFAFKRVLDEDGPLTARLIGYAGMGLDLTTQTGSQPLTIPLRADPVLLRGIEVVAQRLRVPIWVEGMISRRHFGPADLAHAPLYWTVRDFLRAHGYGGTPMNALAPGPRRISPSQMALTQWPALADFGGTGDLYWALWREAQAEPRVVRDDRLLPGGMGLDAVKAYEVYAMDVYASGRGIAVYTKAWVIDHAAQVMGEPPFELSPFQQRPFEPRSPGVPPG